MADPSKTEKPTPRRLSEARKKGQVAKSVEATTAVTFITALVMLKIYGRGILGSLKSFVEHMIVTSSTFDLNIHDALALRIEVLTKMLSIVAPFFIAFFVVAVAINVAQVGFNLTFTPLVPSFTKFNPITGLAKMFSKKGLENLSKSLAKLGLVMFVVYGVIKNDIYMFFPLIESEVAFSLFSIANICFKIGIRVALIFFIIAIVDFSWQKYSFLQNMKMSKQEVKDEMKRSEGNPQIKAEMRKRMRQMMRGRMMAAVPEADVVVTNPVHLAVAIKYDATTMDAPEVVAKGARLVAENIKELAKENNIPIIENKPLARSLFQAVEVGDEVPEDLFAAVAEVLTYVYQLTGKSFGL